MSGKRFRDHAGARKSCRGLESFRDRTASESTVTRARCISKFTQCFACHEICALRFTKSAVPATKSALRSSQNAAPATKSALRGLQRCACYDICTSRFTKCCACHEICASRFTKPRNLQTSHMSKSHDSLHLSRNQSADHVQSTARATKNLHFEVKPLRPLAPVTKSRL